MGLNSNERKQCTIRLLSLSLLIDTTKHVFPRQRIITCCAVLIRAERQLKRKTVQYNDYRYNPIDLKTITH